MRFKIGPVDRFYKIDLNVRLAVHLIANLHKPLYGLGSLVLLKFFNVDFAGVAVVADDEASHRQAPTLLISSGQPGNGVFTSAPCLSFSSFYEHRHD